MPPGMDESIVDFRYVGKCPPEDRTEEYLRFFKVGRWNFNMAKCVHKLLRLEMIYCYVSMGL